MYFNRCTTPEEAKAEYHRLALLHHPDRGGDLRTMQDINAQYAAWCASYARSSEYTRQRQAHAEGKKTCADYHNIDEVAEVLRAKIEAALNLGLTVELCGLWVWVTGDTRPHKEELKSLAFKWAPHKEAWYFAGVPSFNRKEKTLDEIRSLYGSQTFTRKDDENAQPLPA